MWQKQGVAMSRGKVDKILNNFLGVIGLMSHGSTFKLCLMVSGEK